MQYKDFTAEDFITDPDFINWVKQPDAASDQFWNQWLQENPEMSATVEESRAFILNLDFVQPEVDSNQFDQMLGQLHTAMEEDAGKKSDRYVLISIGWRIAASILLIASSLSLFFWWKNASNSYQTQFGETLNIELPDHSKITLNANSKLWTKGKWTPGKSREVWLEGEAYFEVTKSTDYEDANFIVYAGNTDIKVLGTRFNVNSRAKQTQVILEEGKIQVTLPDATEKILAKTTSDSTKFNLIEYQPEKENYFQKYVDSAQMTSWKDKVLRFNYTPLSELVKILEENYGFEVLVEKEELLQVQLSGSMPYGDAELVFKAMQTLFNLEIEKLTDKRILLRQKS